MGNPNLSRGPGRPPGKPNKLTSDVKAMILGALEDAGGRAYLSRQAEENPSAFMALLGKIVPAEMHVRTSVLDSLSDDELADFLVAVREARRARDQVTTHRHDPVH